MTCFSLTKRKKERNSQEIRNEKNKLTECNWGWIHEEGFSVVWQYCGNVYIVYNLFIKIEVDKQLNAKPREITVVVGGGSISPF